MGYRWNIFLSYRREPTVQAWVRDVLVPGLRMWLPHEGGLDAGSIFFDIEHASLPIGGEWPQGLATALAQSACLLPVLCPPYFESAWCLAEFHTMLERQRLTRQRLLYPVRFSDGDYFPEVARQIQDNDFRDFNWRRNRPPDTKAFANKMQAVCREIRDIIRNAPPMDPTWPVVTPPQAAAPPTPKPVFRNG